MHKYNANLKYLLILLVIFTVLLLVAWSCAAVRPPGGGPEDTTPPYLISVDPPSKTININGGQEIRIGFSEYIDEKTVENGFYLSPITEFPLQLKYKDDEIIVNLPDSLIHDQTYVITIGRQLKDERGVELAEPVPLAYSTGDRIEHGVIRGKVYFNDGPAAVHLWDLSLLSETDSVFAQIPHFRTDAADDGSFSFQFLRPARYQILAIERAGVGYGLKTERFSYGLSSINYLDLTTDSLIANVDLPMWHEPQKLKLLRGDWTGHFHGRLYFNNALQSAPEWLKIIDDAGNAVFNFDYLLDPLDSSSVLIVTDDSVTAVKLNLWTGGLLDVFEQELDTASVTVRTPTTSDTMAVNVLIPETNMKLVAGASGLNLVVDKPVAVWPDTSAIRIVLNDTTDITFTIDPVNLIQTRLISRDGWSELGKYKLIILGDSLIASDGSTLADSLLSIEFSLVAPVGRGGLTGKILTDNPPIMAQLSLIENSTHSHISFVNSESNYSFNNIPEGYYNLMVFKDTNQNLLYDFGSAFPFISSEWFHIFSDTMEVRASWIIETPKLTVMEGQ